MPMITPHLWFDRQAEEAVAFYTSIFPNSRTGTVVRYTDEVAEVAGMPTGTVLNVDFELDGQQFIALKRRTDVQVHRGSLFHDHV